MFLEREEFSSQCICQAAYQLTKVLEDQALAIMLELSP